MVKKLNNLFILLIAILLLGLPACSGTEIDSENYPKDPEDVRREKRGKLTGEGGFKLFGGGGEESSKGATLGINSYLWRATLDTLSFVPLASVDPRGGVIITDWYESPEAPGEKFKINVIILDTRLRADGVRVSVFRQVLKNGSWRDAEVNEKVARDLEDKILTRAREMRIKAAK